MISDKSCPKHGDNYLEYFPETDIAICWKHGCDFIYSGSLKEKSKKNNKYHREYMRKKYGKKCPNCGHYIMSKKKNKRCYKCLTYLK